MIPAAIKKVAIASYLRYINFELPMKQSINYFTSQSSPLVYLSTIQAVSQPVNQLYSQSISQSTIQSVNGPFVLKNDLLM